MNQSESNLEIIRTFIINLGKHQGPCEFPEPGQGCAWHLAAFEARRRAAGEALAFIERGLGLPDAPLNPWDVRPRPESA